ncbi:hypothetical protein THAOC_20501, partial [Thalassiosira oceanica]
MPVGYNLQRSAVDAIPTAGAPVFSVPDESTVPVRVTVPSTRQWTLPSSMANTSTTPIASARPAKTRSAKRPHSFTHSAKRAGGGVFTVLLDDVYDTVTGEVEGCCDSGATTIMLCDSLAFLELKPLEREYVLLGDTTKRYRVSGGFGG